jgi:hypothetical protein
MAERVYGISIGDALHIVPADSHEQAGNGELIVHGKEDHKYASGDWDLVMWAPTRNDLYSMVGRLWLAPRLTE